MGTRELLTYLEKLEIGLSSFSYEELGVVEAGELKKSFEVFKVGLENKVFGISEMKQLERIYEKVGIQSLDNRTFTESDSNKFLSLVKALENTTLTKEQRELVDEIRKMAEESQKDEPRKFDNNRDTMSSDFEFIEKSLQAGFAAQN
ncbi:MAG: hypothetical protein VX772_00625, partial [Bacteroidota bacterium]|nr:hypothetical protein [Bacteroidota bacterium]